MKEFAQRTDRDRELDAGYLRRAISIRLSLNGETDISLSTHDEGGRLDLDATIQAALDRFTPSLAANKCSESKEAADYLHVEMAFDCMEEQGPMIQENYSIQAGECVIDENKMSALETLVKAVKERFLHHLEWNQLELE